MNMNKFLKIYDSFLESGLSVKDFCNNEGMRPGKFFYWKNKLQNQLPPKKGFVPIILNREGSSDSLPVSSQNKKPSPSEHSFHLPTPQSCEISYPNGVSLKLNGCNDIDLIRSLILLNPLDHV